MSEGVDYSGDRPSGICLYASGRRFVARYFGAGGDWKHASRAECAAHIASGLAVVSLVEGDKYDPLDGNPRGRAHAIMGDAAARAAGMPNDRPLYFAVDFDANASQLSKVGQYLDGAAATIGRDRVGIYGGYDAIAWAVRTGKARWFFQTYAWSGGRWHPSNHFEQYRNGQVVCGARVDLCRSRKVDFGQWPKPSQTVGSAPGAPPVTTVNTGWDFTTHIDALAGQVGDLGATVNGAAAAIESLS